MNKVIYNVPNCIGYIRLILLVTAILREDGLSNFLLLVISAMLDMIGNPFYVVFLFVMYQDVYEIKI